MSDAVSPRFARRLLTAGITLLCFLVIAMLLFLMGLLGLVVVVERGIIPSSWFMPLVFVLMGLAWFIAVFGQRAAERIAASAQSDTTPEQHSP